MAYPNRKATIPIRKIVNKYNKIFESIFLGSPTVSLDTVKSRINTDTMSINWTHNRANQDAGSSSFCNQNISRTPIHLHSHSEPSNLEIAPVSYSNKKVG